MRSVISPPKAPVKLTLVLGAFSLALIVAGFFWLDQSIAHFFKKPEMEKFYAFNREITNAGYSIHYFVAAAIGLIASRYLYTKIHFLKSNPHLNKALGEWSLFVFKCLIGIGIVGQIIKILVGRQRPHTTVDFENLNFSSFSLNPHYHSFPSGHTQVMLTMATILTLMWPKWRYLWFSLGIYLGFTRVIIHQHFFSDFAGGTFLGIAGTLWIYYIWPPKLEQRS